MHCSSISRIRDSVSKPNTMIWRPRKYSSAKLYCDNVSPWFLLTNETFFNRRKAGTAGNVFQQAAATMVPVEGVDAPAYNKLYKQLGTRNNNKEVRSHIQQRLDSTIEAPMSPNF